MYGKLLSTHLRYFSVDAFFEKKINYFHAVAEEMCERAQTIRWGRNVRRLMALFISRISSRCFACYADYLCLKVPGENGKTKSAKFTANEVPTRCKPCGTKRQEAVVERRNFGRLIGRLFQQAKLMN